MATIRHKMSHIAVKAVKGKTDGFLPVAFRFKWRSVSELFGEMFQDYLAYTASACADHKTVPRRFNYFIGDEVKVVNSENPFNLGEESS